MYSRLLKTLGFVSGTAIGIGMGYKIAKRNIIQNNSESKSPLPSFPEESKPFKFKKPSVSDDKKYWEKRSAEELDDMIRSNHDDLINGMLSRRASR